MLEQKNVWRRLGRALVATVLLVGIAGLNGCIFVDGGHHHHHHWHDDW